MHSLPGFDVKMGLHYGLAATYKPQAHLIGSNTLRTGIESMEMEYRASKCYSIVVLMKSAVDILCYFCRLLPK